MLSFMLELPLITLRIHHKTTYCYRQPVSLGPHRLMVRRGKAAIFADFEQCGVTPDAVCDLGS